MKLTILGCYGPYPPAGGACSGYLLEHEGWNVLLDCGNGVLSKLQQFIEIEQLDAVVLSHLHSDHISDCFILRNALKIDFEKGMRTAPLSIFAPDNPPEDFNRLFYKDIFNINPINENEIIQTGPFQFSFLKTVHSVPCFAVKVSVNNSMKTMVYSSDTEYFDELSCFARGTSLFLCEANLLSKDLELGAKNHLSANQAATLGNKAQVKQLLLTHLPPFRDSADYLEEAKQVFDSVQLAKEGDTIYLNNFSSEKSQEWIQLTVETDPIKASLLEGRLKSEGIPVMLRNDEAAGQIYGLTVGRLAEIRIFVPEKQIQLAQSIIKQIDENNSSETEYDTE